MPEDSRLDSVVILTAWCSKQRKLFGIRMERTSRDQWSANWAFTIKGEVAKREGYDKNTIRGEFLIDGQYPGCPYCEQMGIVVCECKAIFCANLASETVNCPSCGETGFLGGGLSQIQAGTGF
jgi:hypothetical protein